MNRVLGGAYEQGVGNTGSLHLRTYSLSWRQEYKAAKNEI